MRFPVSVLVLVLGWIAPALAADDLLNLCKCERDARTGFDTSCRVEGPFTEATLPPPVLPLYCGVFGAGRVTATFDGNFQLLGDCDSAGRSRHVSVHFQVFTREVSFASQPRPTHRSTEIAETAAPGRGLSTRSVALGPVAVVDHDTVGVALVPTALWCRSANEDLRPSAMRASANSTLRFTWEK
ncbi:MAG: hypothetical protein FJX46_05185 [Alphaproteobacteria bacterium]|nr:hypothetical protein [Alphaproteobacteria bacterium]